MTVAGCGKEREHARLPAGVVLPGAALGGSGYRLSRAASARTDGHARVGDLPSDLDPVDCVRNSVPVAALLLPHVRSELPAPRARRSVLPCSSLTLGAQARLCDIR